MFTLKDIKDSDLEFVVGSTINPDIGMDDKVHDAGPFVILIETGNPREGFINEPDEATKPGAVRLLPAAPVA